MDGPLRSAERQRIQVNLDRLAEITEDGPGWTRRVFGEADRVGREHVANLMREAGLECRVDAVGNVIGWRRGSANLTGALVTGSHTDTVTGGGRFDGIIGVIGGIEVARILHESGVTLAHDLVVADFLGEEPNDFGISCVGSRALAGSLTRRHLELTDQSGTTLGQAIMASGGDAAGALELAWGAKDVHRYFELHVEQGPYLEQQSRSIGIVTGIVGIQRFRTSLTGRPDHAGTTAMGARRDAGLAGAEMMLAIESLAVEAFNIESGGVSTGVATTGAMELMPGATNVVPASALLSSECRSIDPEWFLVFREALEGRLASLCERRSVQGELDWLTMEPPTPMDAAAMSIVGEAARVLGHEPLEMASFAGHDAVQIANLGPCGMIFVPSLAGRSHCPEEWTDLEDIARGVDTLAMSIYLADKT